MRFCKPEPKGEPSNNIEVTKKPPCVQHGGKEKEVHFCHLIERCKHKSERIVTKSDAKSFYEILVDKADGGD